MSITNDNASHMYDLHKLGWDSFQRLCLTVTREILGQTVESFLNSHDGGRDGAFTGTWKKDGQEDLSGKFVIQCKFTSKSNYNLKISDLTDEFRKARKLVDQGECDSYVLMTNAGLSGVVRTRIDVRLKSVGVKQVRIHGSDWINQQILESKRLRTLVPRVYGLGDLSQILDERAYEQSQAVLEFMREDLAKVVVTDAYQKAVDAINKHRFVLLIGEPAAGKTTIASLLAMAALDQWNTLVLKLDEPKSMVERWNTNEPSQFFWVDDAFGVTQYQDSLVKDWNRILIGIRTMISGGARIVLTSRDYIYNRARQDLKNSAFPLLNESQVTIDVRHLALYEKRQILYNHIKLGNQIQDFRSKIKPYLERVAAHDRFIPEIARRLADSNFTKSLRISDQDLDTFVENREMLLQQTLKELDLESRASLALIYMRNGSLASPIDLQSSEVDALDRLGSDLGRTRIALEALEGSFVLHSHANDESMWQFRHPTIGDAFSAILAESPDLIDILVRGSDPERLFRLVTCGDVGLENAVVVPRSLFPEMLLKINGLQHYIEDESIEFSGFWTKLQLLSFLSSRCSTGFLEMYLSHYPTSLDKLYDPKNRYLGSAEFDLAARLHQFGLLPNHHRETLVAKASKQLLEGEDCSALASRKIQSLYSDEELRELFTRVEEDLVPDLEDICESYESSYSLGEEPESHFQPLFELLSSLQDHFAEDQEMVNSVEWVEGELAQWIEDNCQVWEPDDDRREFDRVSEAGSPESGRSIFDDIDEA